MVTGWVSQPGGWLAGQGPALLRAVVGRTPPSASGPLAGQILTYGVRAASGAPDVPCGRVGTRGDVEKADWKVRPEGTRQVWRLTLPVLPLQEALDAAPLRQHGQ